MLGMSAVVREHGVESVLLRVEVFRRFVAVVAPRYQLCAPGCVSYRKQLLHEYIVIRDVFAWFLSIGCLVLPGIIAYNTNLKRKKRTHVYDKELHTLPRMRFAYYNPPVLLPSVPFTREPVSTECTYTVFHIKLAI